MIRAFCYVNTSCVFPILLKSRIPIAAALSGFYIGEFKSLIFYAFPVNLILMMRYVDTTNRVSLCVGVIKTPVASEIAKNQQQNSQNCNGYSDKVSLHSVKANARVTGSFSRPSRPVR